MSLELGAWIDSVQAKLNERLGHVAPGVDHVVAIGYTRGGKEPRATTVPRVEWDDAPDVKFERPLRSQNAGIGTWWFTQKVRFIAATIDDCRALAVNTLQAMLLVTDPTQLTLPIPGTEKQIDVNEHGRLAKKLTLLIGVAFTVPEDPMELGSYEPIGPTQEIDVDAFESTVGGETWTQP